MAMRDDLHQLLDSIPDGDVPVIRHILQRLKITPPPSPEAVPHTVQALEASGLIGVWEHRSDIGDSVDYARQLRDQAERR